MSRKRNIHESDGEPDTCVEPNGEHECTLTANHTAFRPHQCACGFRWETPPREQ